MGNKEYPIEMHTAEHILNQTMVRMFNKGRSFSAHIEKKKSKCDYHFDRALTDTEVSEIENRVNDIIQKKLPVTESFLSRKEAGTIFDLSRVPDTESESLRVIKVGDYDTCLCIGEHVNNTEEIGTFKLISSDFAEGVLRIRFKLL